MKLLNNILLGEDFGKSSKNTLESAIILAKTFNSKVTPIYVLPDDIVNEKAKNLLVDAASQKLKETIETIAKHGIKTGEPLLKHGSAIDAIARAAVEINSNLLVLGAGESSVKQNFKLGTTAERIIQKSEKPVFVVKEKTPLNIRQILCPIDFSPASQRALTNAIIIAKKFKAQLTILSVCEIQTASWFITNEVTEMENKARCEKHKARFESFLKGFSLSGLNWEPEIPQGIAAEEILNTISKKSIDLLVMGTAGRTGLNRLMLGSVTEKVIREVPCSFLTLKSEDALSLSLDSSIKDLEGYYKVGVQLLENGFYDEALGQFKACLNINNMHIPSYIQAAKVYDSINEPEKAKLYRNQAFDIKEKLSYGKIEDEVRKLRGS
ncbi:universal stress protein [Confluentibacter citreus]|uniref:universal stress protein n=1 Tax=Confluentibacter citreus TaxID=2007307 RepID=UPI000C2855C2|nr:universal stress protein [Confluentibacter citreus]